MKRLNLLTIAAAVTMAFSAHAADAPKVEVKQEVKPASAVEVKTVETKTVSVSNGSGKEQFFPITNYKMGPYAGGGRTTFQGYIDYLAMLNARDQGINGVKLTWEECETEYKNDLGVACYDKYKDRNPAPFNFISTSMVYATLDKSAKDKNPLVFIGYGRTDASDGRYFPYAFPLLTNYLSQSTAKIKYIGQREGGMSNLKGKKIVNLYHGSVYGRETLDILKLQSEKYGFEVINIEVPPPGVNQEVYWQKIRQYKPDWVILRSWGVMGPSGLRNAAKIGFPMDKIIGNWWAGAEEDIMLLGQTAKGYIAPNMNAAGTNFPVLNDVMKYVYKDKKSEVNIGSVYYNRGIMMGVINTEVIRIAQEKYGKGNPVTGEQMQWALEHLKFDVKRLEDLGSKGLFSTFATSCEDHEGHGNIFIQQWDGKGWKVVSEIEPDNKLWRPLVEASAEQYAKEKGLTKRDCSKQ